MENHYTLFRLNEHIRRIVALNLPDALWISCETAQVHHSRGHVFLHLVQKDDEQQHDLFFREGTAIIAQAEGVIWANDYRRLKRKIGAKLDRLLKQGMQVLLRVKVDFNERYGLKLIVADIDPDYTTGKLAKKREDTIAVLKKNGLLEKNSGLVLPAVIQKVAVLSAPSAAGYQDYLNHLKYNSFDYLVESELFPTAMQGENVKPEMLAQLEKIEKRASAYDIVIIIRGGGAKLDLVAFDELELGKAIASCSLPVISGIGHDIDETVTDLVAHTALKTPTAVADFILQHNLRFEMEITGLGSALQQLSRRRLTDCFFELQKLENRLKYTANAVRSDQSRLLEYIEAEIPRLAFSRLKTEGRKLENLDSIIHLLSPGRTLKRGFSITRLNGRTISELQKVEAGDYLETILRQGTITSKVVNKRKNG